MTAVSAIGQQTGKVTRTYFPDPDIEINTPAFQKKHGFTGYKEMMNFLEATVKANPGTMKVSLVGKTQRGRDIPMVKVSNGGADHLRVLYTACVHGNEPGSTEGMLYFLSRLGRDKELQPLLDKIDFYIMPMVNIDGSENNDRYTANGLDLNRDQTILATPEARTMHRVAAEVRPQVYIDFHEYKPLRASYEDVSEGRLITNPNDFMFLWSSNPNVAPQLSKVVSEILVPEAQAMAAADGLTNHTYFTTKSNNGETVFNIGGSSPRSSSNIMALRGAASMLMEVRGVGLGRTSYKRRANTVNKLAESYARSVYNHDGEFRAAAAAAAADRKDLAVTFRSKAVEEYPLEFIDILKCRKVTYPVSARIAPETEVTMTRKRPRAYYIMPDQKRAVETLRNFGVEMTRQEAPARKRVESCLVTKAARSHETVAGINPMNVVTEVRATDVEIPAGAWRVPMDQPLTNLIGVLLEPESANGFVNYRVIDAEAGKELGVYREM